MVGRRRKSSEAGRSSGGEAGKVRRNRRVRRPSGAGPERGHSRPPAERLPFAVRLKLWGLRVQSGWVRLRRPLLWSFRLAVVLAVTAGAVATGRLIERHVRTAEAFTTRQIEVEGQERLAAEYLLATAGLALGQNVFEVAPEEAKARLLAEPWIVDADVQRRLPGSYRIRVRERTAVALLVLDEIFLVGDDATAFKRLEPGDPRDLPVVTGVDPQRFQADPAFRAEQLVNVVALLHDYRDAGLWRREPIAEIHADSPGGLALYVGQDATFVRLGKPPFRKKLKRLRGVFDQLRRDKSRPAYVYLDNLRRPDRVTVRVR